MSNAKFPYFIYFSKDLEPIKEQEVFFSKKGYIYAAFYQVEDLRNFLHKPQKKVLACLINFNADKNDLKECASLIKSYETLHRPDLFALLSEETILEKKQAFEWGISEYFSPSREIEKTNQQIDLLLKKKLIEWDDHKRNINYSVTIIDDSVNVLNSLKTSLNTLGFKKVNIFKSGEEILRDFIESDIYLVDIVMSKISGLETMEEIRKRKPDALIFAMSSVQNPDIALEALKRGADDFFPKPLSPSELSLKIFQVIEKRGLK